ncbi:hypothetical protein [Profundibacter amoris]|uniref:hypothetical protein n=1 Tax=Profundibacter amoris TaxID=2171755 RepID=UPI0013C364C2|nr:hypothetical protein [Profundibacter amoris]
MKNGPQTNTLLEKLQEKALQQESESSERIGLALSSFEADYNKQLQTALSATTRDMDDLVRLTQEKSRHIKHRINQELDQLTSQIEDLDETRKLTRMKGTTLMATAMTIGACSALLGSLLVATWALYQPAPPPVPVLPQALKNSEQVFGHGGIYYLTKLREGVRVVSCPQGTEKNRICLLFR